MKEMWIKIIKSDWSDKDKPINEKVLADNDGSFYILDPVHNVRIWVFPDKQTIKEK
jgi:hypothetical protein